MASLGVDTAVLVFLLVILSVIAGSSTQFTKPGHKYKVNLYLPSDCGEATFSGMYGVNVLSQKEGTYMDNMDCLLHLKVPTGFIISLTFSHFDLEPAAVDGSCKDYLQIFNGNGTELQVSQPLCGSTLPRSLLSNTSVVTLKFHTNGDQGYTGFQLMYDRHPADVLKDDSFLHEFYKPLASANTANQRQSEDDADAAQKGVISKSAPTQLKKVP